MHTMGKEGGSPGPVSAVTGRDRPLVTRKDEWSQRTS